MPRETVTIALSSLRPFEASALFFGVLIHPIGIAQRKQLILAEHHRQMRKWAKTDPKWQDTWQYWPPRYLLFDPKLAEKLHKQAMRILDQERMIAAELALAIVHEALVKAVGGDGLKLREDGETIGSLSFENLGLWALRHQRRLAGRRDNPDKMTPKTIEQRAWKETKPVLHLALAYHCMSRGKTTAEREAVWAAMFNAPCEAKGLLSRAEWLRQLLLETAQHGRFKLSEEDTVLVAGG